MSMLIHDFYVQPMDGVYFETAAIFVIWTLLMLLLRGKGRKGVAIAGAMAAVGLILFMTVYRRSGDDAPVMSLIPFISFQNALIEPELYRTMFMNMLLFMPLGLSMPFALCEKKRPVLITVAVGLLLSVSVEAAQLVFRMGVCETDDVIMNVLGVIVGSVSYLICAVLGRIREALNRKFGV